LVGYTNAGKSTLFNTLTEASGGGGAYADDKLFATLSTRTRQWRLGGGDSVMLSDTVGFVRDLPHHLVASFKATLEEAVH
ncbi:GTPase, partial [Planococcus sp. SIMBA_160]